MSDQINYANTPSGPLGVYPYVAIAAGKPSILKDVTILGAGFNLGTSLIYNSPYYQDAGVMQFNNLTPTICTNAVWQAVISTVLSPFIQMYTPAPNFTTAANGQITSAGAMAAGNCLVFIDLYLNNANPIVPTVPPTPAPYLINVQVGISINGAAPTSFSGLLNIPPIGQTPYYYSNSFRIGAVPAGPPGATIQVVTGVNGGVGFNNILVSACRMVVQCAGPPVPIA